MFRMLSILDRLPIGVQKMLGWTLLRLMPFYILTSITHFSWEIQKTFMSWPPTPFREALLERLEIKDIYLKESHDIV